MDESIIVVSGMPRSGTSLMMQTLAAGGVPVFTDEKRAADAHNYQGYFEHEAVKTLEKDNRWLENVKGQALKIVSPLLRYLPEMHNYKIIFMERNIGEIILSQNAMLKKNGKGPGRISDIRLHELYAKEIRSVKSWMDAQSNIDVLYVHYADLIRDAVSQARRLENFLDRRFDVPKMAAVADKKMYRSKITAVDDEKG